MIGKLISSAGFLSSGGTIGGDLTISGDLTVEGGGGFAYSEVVTGDMTIKSTGDAELTIEGEGARADANTPRGQLNLTRDVTSGTVQDDDIAGIISINATDASGNDGVIAETNYLTSTATAGSVVGDIVWKTVQGTNIGTRTEAMRIQGGNVGIGESTPVFAAGGGLHIANTTQANLRLEDDSTEYFDVSMQAGEAYLINRSSDGAIGFWTNTTSRMVIDNNSRISLGNNDNSGGATNTIFGHSAGNPVSGATYNTFIGYQVSDATMTDASDYNTGVGSTALSALTSGRKNTAIGHGTLILNTEGDFNTAIGTDALGTNADTDNNTAVGQQAGYYTTGADNTYVGFSAGFGASGADANNTAVGSNALLAITTGVNNIAIGKGTSLRATTVNKTTFVGTIAGQAVTTTDTGGGGNESDGTVGVGYSALYALTSGIGNVAIGYQSQDANVSGDYNTSVGHSALGALNQDGHNANTAVGYQAATGLTTGTDSTAIGMGALFTEDVGNRSVAIGTQSLYSQNTASAGNANNVAVGVFAGYHNVTGINNTKVGVGAGQGVSTKSHSGCVFIGSNAGYTAYTGDNNIAIGYGAMDDVDADATVGASTENVFIGKDAGGGTWDTAASNYNVAVGNSTMDAAMNGALGNTSVGYNTLTELTEGDGNTAIGLRSMDSVTTGNYNTAIGQDSLAACQGGATNVALGTTALYDVTSGDNLVGVGLDAGRAASPSGSLTTQDNIVCIGNTSITAVYVETDAWTTSDIRDKADIANFDGGLDWINAMQPISYVWDKRAWYCETKDADGNLVDVTPQDILDAEPDGTHKKSSVEVGFSAQAILELEQSLGYGSNNDTSLLVDLTGDGTKYSLKRAHMIPMLVNAIKELSAKVEALENK